MDPIEFKRGSTFSYVLALPAQYQNGFFASWFPSAQIRKARNNQSNGLIADMSAFWLSENDHSKVSVYHSLTEQWPVGLAEMDILFTSVNGEKIYSNTLLFEIVGNITRR